MNLNIEIDCAPGALRPDYFFEKIIGYIHDTNKEDNLIIEFLENINKQPTSKLFGCWKWEINFTEKYKELFETIQSSFKTKLTEYYNNSAIRFASW